MRINISNVHDIDIFPILKALRSMIPEVEGYLSKQISLPESLVFEVKYLRPFIEFDKNIQKIIESQKNLHYDVVVDLENEDTITLLKPNDLEQLGIFICDFCGAVSCSEEEKYIHERAHYFF